MTEEPNRVGLRLATILLIDDCDRHRADVRRVIDPSGLFERVLEAHDGVRGLALLLQEQVDLVLCDLEMPALDGAKLLHLKEANPVCSHIPFLFLTATEDMDRRIQLLERGACDLIAKPFHDADLLARLHVHLRMKRLQDELRVKNETLARLSTTDSVTGLRTRRYVSEMLAIEFLRARRYEAPLAVLMADLDHFKQVNDEHGHLGGDAVLRGVADLLLDQVRATDVGGRYGGEEIVVILGQNDVEGARVLAERWRKSVEAARFEGIDGREIRVTISVGVAGYRKGMGCPDDLISAADQALYSAKKAGRNRTHVHGDRIESDGV